MERGLLYGRREAIEQGLEQGQAKIIQQMYDSGGSKQVIANIVKLTAEDVQRILRLS